MPCGSWTRTLATASRTSATARSMGVPSSNCTKMNAEPSTAQEVMLSRLPMPAIAPSTFCSTCVSISCGAAPGWLMVTVTPGKEMSGSAVTGRRMKDTRPMKSSTTNSTIGGRGWRIAHAEMFFTAKSSSGDAGGAGDLHFLALAQEAGGGRDHTLRAAEPGGDDHARLGAVGHLHRAALDVVLRIDDVHVTAVAVGQHRGLGHHRTHCLGDRRGAAGEGTRAQRWVGGQRDADLAQSGLRVDDRAQQPHMPLECLGKASDLHAGAIAHLDMGQVLLGQLAAHLDLAAAGNAKQRVRPDWRSVRLRRDVSAPCRRPV